ncbi:MAG TPA: hypothetical protein EYP98_04180, partial [Planctomycetes bacterium]|nr:hypothetical protein [Planctomycetota bacterium]
RGVDSAYVEHVVLFDFPREPSEYVRRVGRTAWWHYSRDRSVSSSVRAVRSRGGFHIGGCCRSRYRFHRAQFVESDLGEQGADSLVHDAHRLLAWAERDQRAVVGASAFLSRRRFRFAIRRQKRKRFVRHTVDQHKLALDDFEDLA